MINQNDIERVLHAVDIEKVISEYVTLKKSGVNHIGVCPFHGDRTPSMSVSSQKQIFKCFSCGKAGNAIHFVQEIEHISYPEAIKLLARKNNVTIEEPEMNDQQREEYQQKDSLRIVLNRAQTIFQENLKNSVEANNYLAGRSITPATLDEYGAGFASGRLAEAMNGYNHQKMVLAGLLKETEKGFRDHFWNRIMFPIYDPSNNLVGFTGRLLSPHESAPKYNNTPETLLFHKGKVLFGLLQAKKEIAVKDEVLLLEGQFDVLSMADKGIKNCVCGSGTALTDEQIKLLLRYTTNITLMYDGDKAGINATLKNAESLLSKGCNVRVITLPEGKDPDDFARSLTSEKLAKDLLKRKVDFIHYYYTVYQKELEDPAKKNEHFKELARIISFVPDKSLRIMYGQSAAKLFGLSYSEMKGMFKAPADVHIENWNNGFYGIEETRELDMKEDPVFLTINQESFLEDVGDSPVVLAVGVPSKSDIQRLRSLTTEIIVNGSELDTTFDERSESESLLLLKSIFREGISITITGDSEGDFLDFYVNTYSKTFEDELITGSVKSKYIDRVAEMISFGSASIRSVMMATYATKLQVKPAGLKEILAPYLAKRKDKTILERQRLDTEDNLLEFDPETIPSYVMEDKNMYSIYHKYDFYPILNKKKEPVAYMFKNEKGGGHTCVSDFYMTPLLHVYSKDSSTNKRVIQLNHLHSDKSKIVEWQSSIFSNLAKVNERLIDEGAYNFDGSLIQFKRIWKTMSYNFTFCRELKVFGQQTEGFWAFTNAIYHVVDGEEKVEYVDDLGITTHEGENYYTPAFSKIYASERKDNDAFEQDRYFIYKDIPASKRIDFKQWASLMDEVYKINDNGKWSVLFAIMCAFRDFIFERKRYFTTLFFIGPTGSGKSQIAYSIRSLFMDVNAPVFNLNSGTNAAFFMLLERMRNVPVIMEEYNDQMIDPVKFQGLKSAILDGEGKIKVKDMNNKTMDSSKINAIPIPLGQEAPQQDDGSLSNRSILCDVPYKPKGQFSEYETKIYEKLKEHESDGLCNVLVEILSNRKIIQKYYTDILSEEVKRIKADVSSGVSNTEGLNRIINGVALFTAMARLIQEKTKLELPFSYDEFYEIGCRKVIKQVEVISRSNKLSTYFNTINFLITQGKIKIGRELKIVKAMNVSVKKSATTTEKVIFNEETKVLYIDFTSIYPLYAATIRKDPLSESSLRNYFESNKAYIGLCRGTKFAWFEEESIPGNLSIKTGDETSFSVSRGMIRQHNQTSAYMFRYEELKDLMSIDFERKSEGTEEANIESDLETESEENYTNENISEQTSTPELPF